jgi:hypothetical protein
MGSPLDHEFRSRELAGSLRNFLLTVNSGGIALLFSFQANLVEQKIKAGWIVCPITFFLLGLICCGISIFMAQSRELKRKAAAEKSEIEPNFGLLKTSYFWNWLSFALFILAVIFALINFQSIVV